MLFRSEQVPEKEAWKCLEDGKSEQHDGYGNNDAQLDSLNDTVFIPGTVVKCDNRDHPVIQSEDRHEDEALKLEVYAEYGGCGGREDQKDLVHSEGHDRADGLHDNGRDSDFVDDGDCPHVRTEAPKADIVLFVSGKIEIE